ncbi:hypothetical protein Tsubulata_007869 [Turnera subulata]|uniref:Proteasome component Ecm29 N-terminal domain-containing protein n=1 Tax=Turnera subulata TaxID=218843 RepID=A0A9Q0JMT7_9ROSI|nr:hypothetical protein Tsubulata_007869 [Turnera subulata]
MEVKHQTDIGLPLKELWTMYTQADATPMVKNFCIVYVEMAFDRISLKEKENMAPVLLTDILKLPQQHQEIILRIVTKVIGECHATGISEEAAGKYRSLNGSQASAISRRRMPTWAFHCPEQSCYRKASLEK